MICRNKQVFKYRFLVKGIMAKHTCFDCGIEFESKRNSVWNIYCGNGCASRCRKRTTRAWVRGDVAKILRLIQKHPMITSKEIISIVDEGKKPWNVVGGFNPEKIAKGMNFIVNKDLVKSHKPNGKHPIHYEIVGGNSLNEWLNPRFRVE